MQYFACRYPRSWRGKFMGQEKPPDGEAGGYSEKQAGDGWLTRPTVGGLFDPENGIADML